MVLSFIHCHSFSLLFGNQHTLFPRIGIGNIGGHFTEIYRQVIKNSVFQLSTSEPTFIITKLLMDHGADITLQNKHEKTPVQLCRDPRLRELMVPKDTMTEE